MVEKRGSCLRQFPLEELKQLASQPSENVMVEARKATIETIVLPLQGGGVKVVLQGFLEHHFMPGKNVAMDGFYKYPDETVDEMKEEEFWSFS